MKSLIVILIGLFVTWHYTDLSSDNAFQSVLLPILVFIFLVAFAMWLVLKAGFGRRVDRDGYSGSGDGGDGGGFFDGDGGGDGGGGD